ncbi:hypothetical protein F5Y16DRAFT_386643 [Xylariaceae sp. FL0255]|nr:hypothetical protein F5Y16DRAFT_386643 [Xylariaceae sp. FL0255]
MPPTLENGSGSPPLDARDTAHTTPRSMIETGLTLDNHCGYYHDEACHPVDDGWKHAPGRRQSAEDDPGSRNMVDMMMSSSSSSLTEKRRTDPETGLPITKERPDGFIGQPCGDYGDEACPGENWRWDKRSFEGLLGGGLSSLVSRLTVGGQDNEARSYEIGGGGGSDSHNQYGLHRRQFVENGNGQTTYFWWTKTGIIIKYAIFLGLIVFLFSWIIGGRIHARRRLRKGLKPMWYHAWLLSRQERAMVDPAYAWPQATYHQAAYPTYGAGGVYRPAYGMNPSGRGEAFAMGDVPPPPVYDPSRPPVYENGLYPAAHPSYPPPPPMGGSKVDPVQ